MFQDATVFNGDVSKWDTSSVTNMKNMFWNARSFEQNLCGAFWINSKAIKTGMFEGSFGSISRTVCTTSSKSHMPITSVRPGLKILSKQDLKSEIVDYLKWSPEGRCFACPQGSMVEWDVSRVTDMSESFSSANSFNGDISKWDVSRVTNMNRMFMGAKSFDCDLSNWDVSRVTDMSNMFFGARSFKGDSSKRDVSTAESTTPKAPKVITAPMRAVIREPGGMVFYAQAAAIYFPLIPEPGTDEVILSVRAAAINPVDYKVFAFPLIPCSLQQR